MFDTVAITTLLRHVNSKRTVQSFYGFMVLCIVNLIFLSHAEATIFIAKQYGLQCSKCHDKVPILNGFGSSFKSNGYSFDKKPVAPADFSANKASKIVKPPAPTSVDSLTVSKEGVATTAPPIVPIPEKVEYLYKWRSTDGTMNFSDNPLRAQDITTKKYPEDIAVVPRKIQRRGVNNTASASSKFAEKKLRRQTVGSQKIVANQKSAATAATESEVEKRPAVVAVLLPRNYEECMGMELNKAEIPITSMEAMKQFEQSEQSCAPYSEAR